MCILVFVCILVFGCLLFLVNSIWKAIQKLRFLACVHFGFWLLSFPSQILFKNYSKIGFSSFVCNPGLWLPSFPRKIGFTELLKKKNSPPDALSRGKRAWVDRNLEWPLMGDHSTLPFVIWVCVCVLFFLGGLKWPTAIYPNRSNGPKDFTTLDSRVSQPLKHRTAEPMKILKNVALYV